MKREFLQSVKDHFSSEVEQLDFSNSDASAKVINSWVEETTNGKIKGLISPGEYIHYCIIIYGNQRMGKSFPV